MINLIKKLTVTAFLLLISTSVYAQVPQGFNFQAVARGIDGIPLINQELGVQVSVLQGTDAGEAVYTESHTITTNPIGLIQLVIGEGAPAEGSDFENVDWGSDNYFVKLEIDPSGGTEYEELGTSRLLSVPYALLAENVVNGGGSTGEFPLEIDLNTADEDSSFIINIEGEDFARPLQVFSRSSGFNGAIWGEAFSDENNPNNQRGTYGMANGSGTGDHIGLFGGAVNFDAVGGIRMGVYGQAASKAKINYGVQGRVLGDGSGEIVPLGEEIDGNFGSYNIAGGFYSSGNMNGNVGVEGVALGVDGERANFGVIGAARSTATAYNIGIRGEATGSFSYNTAIEGDASGSNYNLGLRLNVYNGMSNIGMEVNADTAAIFNGDVIINGSLIYGDMMGGGSNNIFEEIIVESDTLMGRIAQFKPGLIRLEDENGNYASVSRTGVQFGDENTEEFVFDFFTNNSAQVAHSDYASGERATGFNPGFFYMDIYKNDNFYAPLTFGIGNADQGGKGYFNINSLNRLENGLGDLISLNVSEATEGNDIGGQVGELFLWGDTSPNFQASGQNWENSDHGFIQLFGSTTDGNGWYHNNLFIGVASDGTHEWTDFNISKTNIAGETKEDVFLINGNNGDLSTIGSIVGSQFETGGTITNDQYNRMSAGSIVGGQNSYTDGFVLNHNSTDGSIFEMYSGGNQTAKIEGSNGNITIAGTLNQASDVRLKKDISTLENALENTLSLRGVSYTWKTDVENQNPQIGVIAQEVEEIYPEFVQTDENGNKSVNYAQMTAVLIEAVKALNAEILELKNDNTELQASVDNQKNMEARLAQIEKLLNLTISTDTSINSARD